jgi:hypothetical protein
MIPKPTDNRREPSAKARIINLFLRALKRLLERQMAKAFDPALSRKIDCVIFLLEN